MSSPTSSRPTSSPPVSITAGPLSSEARHAVRNLAAAAAGADGVVPLSEQPLLNLTADDAWLTHVVARTGSDEVVGYLQVDRSGPVASAEITVHPRHRRAGTGRRLLATAELDVTFPLRSGEPGGQSLRVWAHGDLPAARGFAAELGYSPVRDLQFLARPLGSDADRPTMPDVVPDGYTLRTFRPGDEDAWLRLNAEAFATHPEQGRLTLEDLHARQAEPWFDPDGFFLLERDGGQELVAFVWTKIEPGQRAGARDGEIYVVGVAPDAQGEGLGRFMTDVGIAHLARSGSARAVLYVEGDNAPALATYRRAGFRQDARHVQYFKA